LGLLAGPALGQDDGSAYDADTVGELVEACSTTDIDPNGAVGTAFCHGYILGAGHFYLEMVRGNAIQRIACADPPPTLNEIRLTFVDWAATNPGRAEDKAIDGLMAAAAAKWPCS
jgi:hypothetical protein